MTQGRFDAILLVDPRFMGGTATAFASDVQTLSAAGVRLGVQFVRCHGYFQPHETPNPTLLALTELPGVIRFDPARPVSAPIALFHHPLPFFHRVKTPVRIEAPTSVIVTHQAPFRGDGSLDYDPIAAQRRIRSQFGVTPLWAPISGVSRQQLKSFAPALKLTTEDWPNTFNTEDWRPVREKLTGPNLTVGRHGRPHAEKWGATGADIAASLPAGPQTKIRVMGTEPGFFASMGVETADWDLIPFNGEPAAQFLDSLDVFSYFYSPTWTETFGRTIAEAMLMGARCILPPTLQPTFGPHAIYCRPDEVGMVLDDIRANLKHHREAAAAAREFCIETYATDTVAERLMRFAKDTGTTSRRGTVSAPPLTALRKYAGYHRRRLKVMRGQTA